MKNIGIKNGKNILLLIIGVLTSLFCFTFVTIIIKVSDFNLKYELIENNKITNFRK